MNNELSKLGIGKKYHIITYGCQANVRDSETIKAILEDMSFTETLNVDDPVRMFLKEIGKIPLLSLEEETDLAFKMVEGDKLAKKILEKSIPTLENLNDWTEEALHAIIVKMAEEMEVKSGAVYTVLRLALTGVTVTPGGSPEMADILGKEESIKRLKESLEKLA